MISAGFKPGFGLGDFFNKKPADGTPKPPDTSGGMYGSKQPASFWKPPSGFEGATEAPNYDISYIGGGMDKLKDPAYKPSAEYKPYQFSKTSDADYKNTYDQAMNVATTPMMAQGEERMRQATQGWGGNQMSSAASKELAMKNAQQTGKDVADVGKNIGASMSKARMLEGQEIQRQQATEDFVAAGFSEDQAKTMADDILKRAGAMVGGGFNWINFQRGTARDERDNYNNAGFGDSWA